MPTNVTQLTNLVDTAEEATAKLDDIDLRRVAFERVLDHLLRNGAPDAPADTRREATRERPTDTGAEDADGTFASEQQRVDAIATYFKIEPGDVFHLFDASEATPSLVLHPSRLDSTNAVATRQVALLVTGGRTSLGQKTTTSDIRAVVDDYGRLDSSNFMTTLANMTELSVLGKARSPNRVVRMKVLGAEKARELAYRLIGD